jgi:electron transfer flavoprotein alpha subunit
MSAVLVVLFAEKEGEPLRKQGLEAVAAAKSVAESLGNELVVGVIGGAVQAAADRVAGCGAAKVVGVAGPEFADGRYVSDAAAAEAIAKQVAPAIVIGAAGSRWNRVVAGLAQRLDGRADSHITGLEVQDGSLLATRWVYRQRIETLFTRSQRPWLMAVESGVAGGAMAEAGSASVEMIDVAAPPARSRVVGVEAPASDQQTIRPDAELLFVAGAGWTKKQPDGATKVPEAEELILGFLGKTRASLGSTKSLVDLGGEGQEVLGFLTHMNQIGQTGATPRHAKGLSTCCHGEEPHTVGWRFVNERRAISLDPNCGWARGKADVLYVADAFEVMRELNGMV